MAAPSDVGQGAGGSKGRPTGELPPVPTVVLTAAELGRERAAVVAAAVAQGAGASLGAQGEGGVWGRAAVVAIVVAGLGCARCTRNMINGIKQTLSLFS